MIIAIGLCPEVFLLIINRLTGDTFKDEIAKQIIKIEL
jgi:hypothetical protein